MTERKVYVYASGRIFHPAFFRTKDQGKSLAVASLKRKLNGSFCGTVQSYEVNLDKLDLPLDVIRNIYMTIQEINSLNFTAIIPKVPSFLDSVEKYLITILEADTQQQH